VSVERTASETKRAQTHPVAHPESTDRLPHVCVVEVAAAVPTQRARDVPVGGVVVGATSRDGEALAISAELALACSGALLLHCRTQKTQLRLEGMELGSRRGLGLLEQPFEIGQAVGVCACELVEGSLEL
jgi:hypothetical protein